MRCILVMPRAGEPRIEFHLLQNTPSVEPRDRVTYAREIMRESGLRVLPVLARREGRLKGLLYRVNLLSITSTKSDLLVGDVMSEPPLTLSPQDTLIDAVKRLLSIGEWYAPVEDERGRYLGLFGLESLISYYYWNKREYLDRIKCSEAMSKGKLVYINPEDHVGRLWYLMLKHKYAGIPVVQNNILVGIVTQHDLIVNGIGRPELESESNPRRTKVRELMKTPVYTVAPDEPLTSAVRYMVENNIGRVIVTDEKKHPLGIIDREDVSRLIINM